MANAADLLSTFASSDADFRKGLENLLLALEDCPPEVAFHALEEFFHIGIDVSKPFGREFEGKAFEDVRKFLQKWRCESLLNRAYKGNGVCKLLRSLTIFETLKVPLFIDDWGDKQLISDYKEIVAINVSNLLNAPIVHVTHRKEAKEILEENMFKPSTKKNIIEGTWFSRKDSRSLFGGWAFETTLAKLGVCGLCQGETVFYKQMVNVILYATDTKGDDVQKPTKNAAQLKHNFRAYVMISIFVPSKFLPQGEEFQRVVKRPYLVTHGPFCVRQKRSRGRIPHCDELDPLFS